MDNDILVAPSLDRKRTGSLNTADVIKCIEGLDTDDEVAMKQAAWDIAQQVCISLCWQEGCYDLCLGTNRSTLPA